MKHLLFIIGFLLAPMLFGQNYGVEPVIKIGIKEDINEASRMIKSGSQDLNFLDAFEFELALELKNYVEANSSVKVEFVKVKQSEREDLLKSGVIDALIFSFSKTQERQENGISFSYPYHQNRAVVLVTKDEKLTVDDIGKVNLEVGYIQNSTSEDILRELKEKYGDRLIIQGFPDYLSLLDEVNNKRIDAVVGDVSRFAFNLSNGELLLAGDLPLPKAKIRDEYGIAVAPGKDQLLPLFNDFILNRRFVIQSLEDKWLSSSINHIYDDYYIRRGYKEEDKRPLFILGFCVITLLILLILIWRKNIQINKANLDSSVSKSVEGIIQSYEKHFEKKFKAVLEDNEIIEKAIDVLNNTQERVYYLGSGGMLSNVDEAVKEKWQDAMYTGLMSLSKPNFVIRRVIDLPTFKVDNLENNKVHYSLEGIDFNGLDQTEIKRYINSYCRWLMIVYHNLLAYPSRISLFVSRGAPMWGYGMVTIIGDSSGVMFTSHYNETLGKMQKLGTGLINPDWIEKLKQGISGVQKLGIQLDAATFRGRYLSIGQLDEMAEMIKKNVETNGQARLDKLSLQEIDKQCEAFSKKFANQ